MTLRYRNGQIQGNPNWEQNSAAIDVSTSGDNTIVAAQSGKRILAYAFCLQAVGTVNVKFTDGAAGSALTGDFNFQAREGIAPPGIQPPAFLFGTSVSKALVLNLSENVAVKGYVSYMLI